MKFNIPKQWCANMAAKEDGGEISVGGILHKMPHNRINTLLDKVNRHQRIGFYIACGEWTVIGIEIALHLYFAAFVMAICMAGLLSSMFKMGKTKRELLDLQVEMDKCYAGILQEWQYPNEGVH